MLPRKKTKEIEQLEVKKTVVKPEPEIKQEVKTEPVQKKKKHVGLDPTNNTPVFLKLANRPLYIAFKLTYKEKLRTPAQALEEAIILFLKKYNSEHLKNLE